VTPKHAHLKREVNKPGETIFRYVFEQPSDPNREITLTVMAFDGKKYLRAWAQQPAWISLEPPTRSYPL
jgi:hypothetical protein